MWNVSRILIAATAALLFGIQTIAQSKPSNAEPAGDYGKLVVIVRWGDMQHTPASDVYVEAHGWDASVRQYKSFVLQHTASGTYEAELPASIYDVFVSDGTSLPVCKRVAVSSRGAVSWRIQLRTDLTNTLR